MSLLRLDSYCSASFDSGRSTKHVSNISSTGGGTRRRAEKQQRKHLVLESYRARFTKALDAEMNEEMQQMKQRLKVWPKKRLQDEGYALFNLLVRKEKMLFRHQIFRFFLDFGSGFLPRHHQFSQGNIVTISQKDPLEGDEDPVEGVVMERAQRFLRVAVLKNAGQDISSRGQWRLDISANSVSHERCVLAVEHFSSYHIERGRPPEMAKKKEIPSAVEAFSWNEAASAVKGLVMGAGQVEIRSETLFGTLTSSSNDISHDVHVANGLPNRISGTRLGTFRGSYRKLLKETGLNTSQKAAVEAALCRKVTLWQGPPGTGKTKTLVQFVRIHCRSGQGKVLACADSNIAVDNLLEGLLSEGLAAVRIGQPVKVKEELRAVTLEARVSVHPLLKRAIEIKQMAKTRRQNKNKDTPGSLWEKATELEGRACREVISRADVVAATCIGAGDPVLDGLRFTACVIDEATQATEPATLIPLLRSGADCFVLVGDPAQLPPTVVSKEAVECGLEVSLFEHLQACGLSPMLLDTQYRMHPVLARFSSRNFYEGKLFSQPLPAERMAPKGYDWPNVEKPLAFVNCSNGKELMRHDSSWQNEVEALQVVKTVKDLVSGGDIEGGCAGIGIIAPYSAQVKLLQDLFLTQSEDFSKLEIKSVDGFQGREKEVIVFCTVRSNDHGALGFVANPRRMNVAITRARRGLVVVGNASTLESSGHWNLWLKEIREQGLFAPHSR